MESESVLCNKQFLCGWTFSCFHVLATVNSTAVNTGKHVWDSQYLWHQMCGGFPNTKQFCDTICVSYNWTQFWHYLLRASYAARLGLSLTQLPASSEANSMSRVQAVTCTSALSAVNQSFCNHLLRFNSFSIAVNRIQETSLISIYQFILKNMTKSAEQPDGRDTKERYVGSSVGPRSLKHTDFPAPPCC